MQKKLGVILGVLVWISISTSLFAVTYQVGPSRSYVKLQDVTGILNPGDVVEVDGNANYPDGVYLDRNGSSGNPITIRGIKVNGKRPVISGTSRFGIECYADYTIIEGIEFTGGSTKAAYGHYAHKVILRDCLIHDCANNGILGWEYSSGSLTVEYTEFYHTGYSHSSAPDHQIYMSTSQNDHPGSIFRLQYCYIHNGNGGNNVKTRSERNEIYYNWIESAAYHALELIGPAPGDIPEDQAREDSDVMGNVIIATNGQACARIGGDGTGQTLGRYRFVNNTFVIPSNGDVIRTYDMLEALEMHNNVIYNKSAASGTKIINDADGIWLHGRMVKGSNNWVQSGSNNVPSSSEWSNTKTGSDPGFVSASNNDFRLVSSSPLINAGNSSPTTFSSYPFPNPLFPPAYMPPVHVSQLSATVRPSSGTIDIGAYEYGSASSDTTAPTVAITAPTGGATVSGSITISVTANDNVGVVGVQLKVDDNNLGTEITSSPYSILYNTNNLSNASHTFSAVARDAAGNSKTSAGVAVTVNNQTSGCPTATAGGGWINNSFTNQTSTFTVEYDATPANTTLDGIIGISNGVKSAYSDFACLVRFNASGKIDARNGSVYSTATIGYSAGTQYHFRLLINIPAHTYSIYVKSNGGSEQVVGTNFAFRTEQALVSALNNLEAIVGATSGTLKVCNLTITNTVPACQTINAGGVWVNNYMTAQSGTFTVEYDAVPANSTLDGIVGLSSGAKTAYSAFACLVRFNNAGKIDARNGSVYSTATVNYSAGVQYHFRLVVNISTHTYSVYITPAGGSEQTLGTNFAFRSEQSSVSVLNNWGAIVGASSGTLKICGFTIK